MIQTTVAIGWPDDSFPPTRWCRSASRCPKRRCSTGSTTDAPVAATGVIDVGPDRARHGHLGVHRQALRARTAGARLPGARPPCATRRVPKACVRRSHRTPMSRGCRSSPPTWIRTRAGISAMRGVDGVLHVASPFPVGEPAEPDALLKPAVDGTLRVLRAAGRGRRAALRADFVDGGGDVRPPQGPDPSVHRGRLVDRRRSGGLPVRAVQDVGRTRSARVRRRRAATDPLPSVNPGLVLGPLLDAEYGTSVGYVRDYLRGKYPGCPRLAFSVVDVRDVATMHRLRAGNRCAVGRTLPGLGRRRRLHRPDATDQGAARRARAQGAGTRAARLGGAAGRAVGSVGAPRGARSRRGATGRQPAYARSAGHRVHPAADSAVATARSLVALGVV